MHNESSTEHLFPVAALVNDLFQNCLNSIGLNEFVAEYPADGYKGRAFRNLNEKNGTVPGFGSINDISIDRVGNDRATMIACVQ